MPSSVQGLRRIVGTFGLVDDVAVCIGPAIRATRARAGMTQEELAAAIGCSIQAIGRSESGAELPSAEFLAAILEAADDAKRRLLP